MDPSPAVKNQIEKKLLHFERNMGEKLKIKWNCSIKDGRQRSDVHLYYGKKNFHATAASKSLYKTIDDVIAKLKRQVTKNIKRRKNVIHVNHLLNEGI